VKVRLLTVAVLSVSLLGCSDEVPWGDGAFRISPDGVFSDAFDWGDDGYVVTAYNGEIVIFEPESGFIKRIRGVHGLTIDGGVCWSPDGERVAFGGSEYGGMTNIYIINRNSSSLEEAIKITEKGGAMPAWAPDGGTIAYSSPEGVSLIPATGGRVTLEVQDGAYPAWSPAGRYLAYVKGGGGEFGTNDIYVKRIGGEVEKRVTRFGLFVWYPDWAPNGFCIATAVKNPKEETRKNDIWTVPIKGGFPVKITDEPGTNFRGFIGADCPRWTAHGNGIAFISPRAEHIGRGPAQEIWEVRVRR